MRGWVSIGAMLVGAAMAAGDVAVIAAPDSRSQQLIDAKDKSPSVDIELVIAVDISYSMDLDELAVQREGYAQAIVSKEFLQALKTGPNSKVALTYFEWSVRRDQFRDAAVRRKSVSWLKTRDRHFRRWPQQ